MRPTKNRSIGGSSVLQPSSSDRSSFVGCCSRPLLPLLLLRVLLTCFLEVAQHISLVCVDDGCEQRASERHGDRQRGRRGTAERVCGVSARQRGISQPSIRRPSAPHTRSTMDANQTAATATPAAAPAAAAAAGAQRTARGGSGGGGRGGRGGGHSSNGPRPSTGAVAPSPAAASAAGATSAAAASRPPVASAAASASASGASGASAAALSCVSVSSLEPDAKGKNLIVQVREMRLVVQSKQVKIVEVRDTAGQRPEGCGASELVAPAMGSRLLT